MAKLHDSAEFMASLAKARRILVVGGGKAAAGMAKFFENIVDPYIDRVTGIVNVPEGSHESTQRISLNRCRPIGVNEPTAKAAQGAEDMLQIAASATPDDMVVVLLSGGGSALLPAPVNGISLQDKIVLTRLLSAAGATIDELNCVRKHVSRIKGGRLADAARHAQSIWTIVISDVIGDRLDVIASGPTAADPTTFNDACSIVAKYQLSDLIPESVREQLHRGANGRVNETPKAISANVNHLIVASNSVALEEAARSAARLGYRVEMLDEELSGEARCYAKRLAQKIQDVESRDRPCALLVGGETTVSLGQSPGKGGRNQELVLATALELGEPGLRGVAILSAGTDGEDGPTDAAGAMVTQELLVTAKTRAMNPQTYLAAHDAYNFFEPAGGLVTTGLTGTNVMDLCIVLIHPL